MTQVQAEGLARDLLEALGVTRDGSLQAAFLSDTGATLRGVLHEARRREHLLAMVQGVLTEAGLDLGPAETVDGRDWLPVIGPEPSPGPAAGVRDHLDLSVVLDHTATERTVLGLGVRYTHQAPPGDPQIAVHALVPLVVVPVSGDAGLAPGTALGDLRVEARLAPGSDGGAVDVETLRAVLLVPTDGVRPPQVLVTADDLRLGDAEPVDLEFDTADPLVEQALHVAATLLRGLAESAEPRLGALLRLLGLGADAQLPDLPLAELTSIGRAALWNWLRSLAAPEAVGGLVAALRDLLGDDAVVSGDGSAAAPLRVRLPLGPAVLEIAVLVGSGPDGSPLLTPRVSVLVDSPAAGARPRLLARAEVDVVTLRLGAQPAAVAVPGLRLFGRAGPDTPRGAAAALVEQAAPVAVVVGAISAGLELDAQRRLVPLLAAHEVRVGTGSRQVSRDRVDLTDAEAIADLGADSLDALVDEALDRLGAGAAVRAALALLGLRDPHGRGGPGEPAWPHRVDLGDLLADPLDAVAAVLGRVLAAGDLPVLLAEVARLVPRPGVAAALLGQVLPGTGAPGDPWRIALDDEAAADVELTVVAVPGAGGEPHRLALGLRASAVAIAVPGTGGLALSIDADLLALTLPSGAGGAPGAELAPGLSVTAALTGPLLLGDPMLGVAADAVTGGLRWTPAGGLQVTGAAPGLTLDVGGQILPLDLPAVLSRVRSFGSMTGPTDELVAELLAELPWATLEALAGSALRSADSLVVRALADVLDWGRGDGSDDPGEPLHLSLAALVAEPVSALLDWLRELVISGDTVLTMAPVLNWLSALLGGLLTSDDPSAGALRGTGTPADPWALRLRPSGASLPARPGGDVRAAELLLWCEPDGPAADLGSDLTQLALPAWLEVGVGADGDPPSPADLADLLAEVAPLLPGAGDIVRGRPDLAASIAALRDRLSGGDGLLPAAGPVPARWTAGTLPGAGHADLQDAWQDDTLDPATTLFVTGPLGDPARWPLFDPARLADLSAPGLPAAAFDLAAISGPGPWFVALPFRGGAKVDPSATGDGFDDLVERLRMAVAAARTAAGGPITVIAHSATGLVARMLAATAAGGISRLVTLGTPLDGTTVGFADLRPSADAVHALRALWLAAGLPPGSLDLPPELAAGAATAGVLDALLRADPVPPGEFAAPPAWPSEAASVVRESVTGALDAAEVSAGMIAVVRGALQGGLAALGALPPVVAAAQGDPNGPPPADDGTDGAGDGTGSDSGTDGGTAGGTNGGTEPGVRAAVTALATGVRHDLPSPPDPRGITITVRATISGPRLGTALDDDAGVLPLGGLQPPAAEFRVLLSRENGWLVGGPLPQTALPPAARPPRVRWAELVIATELRPGGAATARIVLHEAAALGVERVVWPIRLTDPAVATLPAEARVLLFRLAAAIGTTDDGGALPPTGAARALAEVLRALGLATLDDTGRVGLVTEAVERFLVAPGTALREAGAAGPAGASRRRELARALRVLAGVALPSDVETGSGTGSGAATGTEPAPARVDVSIDGLRLLLDLEPLGSAGAATLDVQADLSLAGLLGLSGGVHLELLTGGARVSASARIGIGTPGSGLPYLALDHQAGGALTLTTGLDLSADVPTGWLPRRLQLSPPPPAGLDVPALLRLAASTAPAVLVRLAGEHIRTALTGTGVGTALDTLLRAAGLLVPAGASVSGSPGPQNGAGGSGDVGRLVVPYRLVLDPGGWLRGQVGLGSLGGLAGRAAATLVDAVRDLTGLGTLAVGTPVSGTLPLPYDLALVVAGDPMAGGLTITLGTTDPVAAAGAGVDIAAGVRISAGPGGALTAAPRLATGLALQSGGTTRATVRLVADGTVRLDLVLPGPPEETFTLVPAGPGLGGLVGAAAVRLLPAVLDAVVSHAGQAGTVVAALGDALGVRTGAGAARAFDPAALTTLAGDPAGLLLGRVRDHTGEVLNALSDLTQLVLGPLPAGLLVIDDRPAGLTVTVAGRVTLALARSACGIRLDLTAAVPITADGVPLGTVTAAAGVDERGLALVAGGVVVDGDLLTVLGVPLQPWADVRYAPAERTPSGDETPASRPTLRAGLIVPEASGSGGVAPPVRAVVVTLTAGQDVTIGVVDGDGIPVTDDTGVAAARVLVPLLLGVATEAVQDLFGTVIGAGPTTIGDALDGALIRRLTPAADWAPLPDLLDPDALLDRLITLTGNLVRAFAPRLEVGALTVTGEASVAGSAVTVRVRLSVEDGETWWLVEQGDIRVGLEVATDWAGIAATDGGLELALTVDPTQANPVRDVTVAVRGITVRVAGRDGEDLLDLGVRLRSVALSAAFVPTAPTLVGGRLALDRLTVPLGGAGGAGGNGVASKVLDSDSTGSGAGSGGGSGDTARPAPGISPELAIVSRAGGPPTVDLRMGDGSGPWWIPLQAQLGPVYIEQFGFGVTRAGGTVTRLRLLVDGGVSIAGLTAQVDDLELSLPWPEPWDVSRWRLDLAGLAVGYEGSGVSLAGALLRTPGAEGEPPSYLGMLVVRAAGFGMNAFGGFGVYPVPGANETYVSLFVVAALHAPLGGVPAFFITGVGGGAGINRALVLPTDIAALPRFPLVQALDPGSTVASDPMGALREMGRAFPPQRGTIWFAAGVSFTSFSLIEGVAVLSISVGDGGVEVALLGLARLGLPNPRLPIAHIELALIARFSTREMVLWIQAQLTDNSWVISKDARLTGGFAMVTWFRTGDFVVTLGGYHPNFRVAHYPQVPRLGLSWTLSSFLSIRGESYFALCSTAVMVGARLDVSFRAGPAYARVVAGFDALVRFDPLYFELDVYASVTGGIRIEIDLGWFGSIVIDLSVSIGARLHIEGPEVHGTATLQMGPVEVPFRFGPQAPPERTPLSWTAFTDKYLRAGGGQVLSVSVSGGRVATPGDPSESRNDGSSPLKPWLVLPEFDLTAATTLAARRYAGAAVPGVGGLGIGPMDIAALASDWRVTVRASDGTGDPDRTGQLTATPRTQGLPPAVWRAPSGGTPALPSGVDLVTGCTGVDLRARAQLIDGAGAAVFNPFEVEQDRDRRKPLPFAAERAARAEVKPAADDAVRGDTGAQPQSEVATSVLGWLRQGPDITTANQLSRLSRRPGPERSGLLPHDGNASSEPADPAEAERVLLLRRRVRGWQAVPRPVRITEGLAPPAEVPVPVAERPPPPPTAEVDIRVGEPVLLAVLDVNVAATPGGGRTTVTRLRDGGAAAAAELPRRAAPSADLDKLADRSVPARLLTTAGTPVRNGSTVSPNDGGVRTAQAGAPGELRRGPAVDPAVRKQFGAAQGQLLGDGGLSVVPGQAVVLGLPNPDHDADQVRPVLRVAPGETGGAELRVVALDRTSRPLADVTLAEGDVEVPVGTTRLVLVGVGIGQAAAAGLAGWAAATIAVQTGPGAAVVAGAVLRGPASPQRAMVADRSARGLAVARAGDVVHGIGLVETTLPAGVRTLIVALDAVPGHPGGSGTQGTGDGAEGLVLGLTGLRRRTGPDGALPPVSVVQGRRTVLLYPVEEDPDALALVQQTAAAAGRTRPADTATVAVASDDRWEVAGVIGGTEPPERLARELSAQGVERLVAPLAGATTGTAAVRWIPGEAR